MDTGDEMRAQMAERMSDFYNGAHFLQSVAAWAYVVANHQMILAEGLAFEKAYEQLIGLHAVGKLGAGAADAATMEVGTRRHAAELPAGLLLQGPAHERRAADGLAARYEERPDVQRVRLVVPREAGRVGRTSRPQLAVSERDDLPEGCAADRVRRHLHPASIAQVRPGGAGRPALVVRPTPVSGHTPRVSCRGRRERHRARPR